MSSVPSSSPVPSSPHSLIARWSKATWVVIATAVALAAMLFILLVAGIPGVSLNAAPSSSSPGLEFRETGLPTGTQWMVIISNANDSFHAYNVSTGSSMAFSVPRGMYYFSVPGVGAPTGGPYSATPNSGKLVYNGSTVSVPLTFSQSLPLGQEFAWGTPLNLTGTVGPGCPATTGHYCYGIEIAGAGGGVTTSNILLSLQNAAGTTHPWPTGIDISLFSPTNSSAVASYDPATDTWTLVPPYGGVLGGGFSLTFYTAGTGASNGLLGLQVVAIGQNGFSGGVPSNAFS